MLTALIAGLVIGAIGYGAYLLLIIKAVPGFAEERFGSVVLPKDLGEWKPDVTSPEGKAALESGLQRQIRMWFYPPHGLFGKGKLVRQARYENVATQSIERVDPEEPMQLQRVKARD